METARADPARPCVVLATLVPNSCCSLHRQRRSMSCARCAGLAGLEVSSNTGATYVHVPQHRTPPPRSRSRGKGRAGKGKEGHWRGRNNRALAGGGHDDGVVAQPSRLMCTLARREKLYPWASPHAYLRRMPRRRALCGARSPQSRSAVTRKSCLASTHTLVPSPIPSPSRTNQN
ncbi:hypothetical protein BC834DRAFT_288035 [Gloeopeniophorella convolvens]|nr:hypothetical protein BC834DRAFT_288035 [Gloeopeniophorella convolvens]